MPPKLTPEQRIESDKKKAEYMKAWRIRNKDKFDTYMHEYYLDHKKIINERRAVNSKLQRRRNKTPTIVITGTITDNVNNTTMVVSGTLNGNILITDV